MEIFHLDHEINLFCVTAFSFPAGITHAFEALKKQLPDAGDRVYFGISYPDKGAIVYKAAVMEKEPGEAEKCGCERYTLPKGEYVSRVLKNWEKNIPMIGNVFQELIHSRPDLVAPCIEWYRGNDVWCLVRIEK